MLIEVRPVQTHAEYRAVEQLQSEVWNHTELDVVPDHLLITLQKNGGLVLGAFETLPQETDTEGQRRLVGFAFGFVGLTAGGKVKHCSHMVGVAPACQNQNVGYRLKLAQREHVLAQGIDLITWTFDPLESRNARLNFHKLGATCSTYLRDVYGSMRDGLNLGLPSDRFQVDWSIASARVVERLAGASTGVSLAALQNEGVPVLNPAVPGDPLRSPEMVLPMEDARVLIQIPSHFQVVKSTDMGAARGWRLHTRALFEAAFDAGYVVVDLVFGEGQSFYVLERGVARSTPGRT